jgi:hypothetical protein
MFRKTVLALLAVAVAGLLSRVGARWAADLIGYGDFHQ